MFEKLTARIFIPVPEPAPMRDVTPPRVRPASEVLGASLQREADRLKARAAALSTEILDRQRELADVEHTARAVAAAQVELALDVAALEIDMAD
mgnify:CR=1 FL=1